MFLQAGCLQPNFLTCFEAPMSNSKVYRYHSAFTVAFSEDQNFADMKALFQSTAPDDWDEMKAGHIVKISFGNDRLRAEPWMIRCFRHSNVAEVAE